MVHPSKNKGNNYERELVNEAIQEGIPAKRAYASNGRSLGMHEEVDCLVGGFRIQAKRRKNVAAHLIPSEHVDCVATRSDRGETLVIMRWDDWLELVSDASRGKES
jgi:hypothetical protein